MDDREAMEAVLKSVRKAHAAAGANQAILMEIVRDLARSTKDPAGYLANKFERISARLDQTPIEDEAIPVVAETRQAISRFFALAGQNLN